MSSQLTPQNEPSYTDLLSYNRTMYKYTRKQMDAASKKARRRNGLDNSSTSSSETESSVSSMELRAL